MSGRVQNLLISRWLRPCATSAMAVFLVCALLLAPARAEDLAATRLQAFLSQNANEPELQRLYQARGFAPAWATDPKGDRAPLAAFVESVAAYAAYHGLNEPDDPGLAVRNLLASKDETDALRLEVQVTEWLLRLAHGMRGDRVNLSHLYPGWSLSRFPKDGDVAEALGAAIAENRVQKFFDELAPKDLNYMRLAEALKTYREIGTWPGVAAGPTLRPGERDPRVAQIRARLTAEGYTLPPQPENDPDLYTDVLKEAVIAYQSRNGLEADGNFGAKTAQAMNISAGRRIGQILANMERLRHMPDEWPARYVRVNMADASISVVEDGRAIYHAVVVVGRPDRKTPFIHSKIRSVIFNPAWTVPTKIAREDILPKLRKDPHYLEKMGMVISGGGEDIGPHGEGIDWNAIKKSEFTFRLRQSPGDLNSLGQIKFDFDNDFSVYLHDTSHPEAFAKPDRHLSSGCVRLKDPERFAEIVLARNEGNWTRPRVDEEIAKHKTRWMRVAEPLPLYILYDTAFFPTPESLLNFRGDVYGYDQLLLGALK